MSQDTLRLRKTPADNMKAADNPLSPLSDIVTKALEEMRSAERFSVEKLPDGNIVSHDNDRLVRIAEPAPEQIIPAELLDDLPVAPISWTKGQLLNVRNRGEFYVITLLGEEDDPPLKPAPNGALRFTNTALCQDFVSKWYATEHHDPRAR
jgi:hypothetical protein